MERPNPTKEVQELFDKVANMPLAGKESLVIWGGAIGEDQLPDFLAAWQAVEAAFAWQMVEEVSRFYLKAHEHEKWPSPALLERMRLFGEDGDLDLRRDGSVFRWRFIGQGGKMWPALGGFDYKDYWSTADDGRQFRVVEEVEPYYQWRAGDGRVSDNWADGADLTGDDVYLKQVHYLDAGNIAFVRYISVTDTL